MFDKRHISAEHQDRKYKRKLKFIRDAADGDLDKGKWSMIGMGSVVTKCVPDFALALGSPAVPVGVVCRCGQLLLRHPPHDPPADRELDCQECGRRYKFAAGVTSERE